MTGGKLAETFPEFCACGHARLTLTENLDRARRTMEVLEEVGISIKKIMRGYSLRVQAPASSRLRWTRDEWQSATDTASSPTAPGIEFVDIPVSPRQRAPIRFTFLWTQANRWEERDYEVAVISG